MIVFVFLLQASEVPTPNVDYSAALAAWSACANAAVASPKQAMPAQGVEALITSKCANEELEFQTRFAAFVRSDGDPTRRAEAMAKAETQRVREHLATRAFQTIETRQFLGDGKLAAPWLACLRKARANPAVYRTACMAEQNNFALATRDRLVKKGTSLETANAWLGSFVRRMRQKVFNETATPPSS
jgi:hypothetical protein